MTQHEGDASGDREELLEQLFHDALDQPTRDRQQWIASATRGDEQLAAELAGLLAAHAEALLCLEQPVWSPGSILAADGEELSPGSTIDSYVVGRLLGEGGMGSVYLAEQREPLRRQVALKVIKPGMDTREVLSRFNAERQVLARLSHAHVAAVYDAGVTPRGRPYFVMEFVDGEPMTRFCDQRRLGLPARLALFEQVCEAVQHAHQKGVLHRDLKPSNILISEGEGRAWPKIIDFGVAKAIGAAAGEQTRCTRLGQQIGTPGYMSPEQALPDQQQVDTRSDVYSLGVLLHELLVGLLPHDAGRLRELGPQELARELAETEVRAPSRRLSGLGAAGQRLAARRDSDLRGLRRRLRGDLDWIVLKALAVDPERRYASVSQLAEDVHSFLDGLPVMAGPPAFFYRARRLASAHRSAVAGMVVGLVALLAWPTALAYLRGQQLRGYQREIVAPQAEKGQVLRQDVAAVQPLASATVHDTVLVTNAGRAPLALGDLVELVGEVGNPDELILSVAAARADSGRAPLGPLSVILDDGGQQPDRPADAAGLLPHGGLGRVVVRGTLALLAVDDSGGPIRANEALVVGSIAGRAAARGEQRGVLVVGTALQGWSGTGRGLIRAFIAPRWNDAPVAAAERPVIGLLGGGLVGEPFGADAASGLTATGIGPADSPAHKLLPSTMPTSVDSRRVTAVAAALGEAPSASPLQSAGLIEGIVDGGQFSTAKGHGGGVGPGSNPLLALSLGGQGRGAPLRQRGDVPSAYKSGRAGGNSAGDPGAGEAGRGGAHLGVPEGGDAASPDELAWGDFDGNGQEDVIITSGQLTTVLANLGQGLFEDRTRRAGLPEGFVGHRLTLVDVSGDGVLDILSLDDEGRLSLLQGLGDGRFRPATAAAGLSHVPPLADLAAIDPEGDGVPDLQLLTAAGDVLFLLNDGRATFTISVLRQRPPTESSSADDGGGTAAAAPAGTGPGLGGGGAHAGSGNGLAGGGSGGH